MVNYDIFKYLSSTFKDDVISLLVAMSASDCIITGPKAMEFFAPNLTSKHSEWIFIVPNDKKHIMIKYLGSIEGFVQKSINLSSDGVIGIMNGTINNNINNDVNEQVNDLRLVWSIHNNLLYHINLHRIDKSLYHAYITIFGLTSSIDQCFITATHAVCPHKKEMSRMTSYCWDKYYVTGDKNYSNIRKMSNKIKDYELRGVKYIPFDHNKLIMRRIDDDNCIIVDFLHNINNRNILTSFLYTKYNDIYDRYIDMCEDEIIQPIYLNLSWIDELRYDSLKQYA